MSVIEAGNANYSLVSGPRPIDAQSRVVAAQTVDQSDYREMDERLAYIGMMHRFLSEFPSVRDEKRGITVHLVTLTPEIAAAMLARKNPRQRPIRERHWKKMARSLLQGDWHLNGNTMQIDVKWNLVDGQHRCMMVVKTGKPIFVVLVTGVPESGIAGIDQNEVRTLAASMIAAGLLGKDDAIYASIAQAMYAGIAVALGSGQALTNDECKRFLDRFSNSVEFVKTHLYDKRAKMRLNRQILACVGRAYLHVDQERLAEWCYVVLNGEPVSKFEDDSAAIRFREVLLASGHRRKKVDRYDVYRKCQASIQAFVRRQNYVGAMKPIARELYPLPEALTDVSAPLPEELERA